MDIYSVLRGVLVIVILFMTYRIAVPFYRFEKSLDEMVDGDVSQKII